MKISLFTAFIIILVLTSLSNSQTIIPPGDVSGTWGGVDSSYHIEGDITIPNDSTLTIEPGVEVIFFGHHAMNVQGRLLALGTENDSIVFTVNDTTGFSDPDTSLGGWNGIRFISTPLSNDSSKFVYCKFKYGKAISNAWPDNSGGALFISNFHKVHISHSLFISNTATGLLAALPSGGAIHLSRSNILLSHNSFIDNHAINGGAIQFYESYPIFISNDIMYNTAMDGGGISFTGKSSPTFMNDNISHNNATNLGGGIFYTDSTAIFNTVTIANNRSDWGGGVGVINGALEMNNCIINDNYASRLGGGIASDFSTLNINNVIFERDSAGQQSGALHSWYSNITAEQCQLRNNIADFGGSIHSEFSDIEMDNCTFSRNSTIDGAGIHAKSTHLKIDSCNFSQNTADNSGGAIEYIADTLDFIEPYQIELTYNQFALNYATNLAAGVNINQVNSDTSLVNLIIDNCSFTANNADHVSALRIIGSIHDFTISNSIFSGNNAYRWAAGANFVSKCKGKVINCLFNSNQADIGGGSNSSSGGAGVAQEAKVDFYNCTFANNSAGSGSGLHIRLGGIANLMNSIFWGNSEQQINMVTIDSRISLLTINTCAIQNGIDSIGVDSLSVLNWGQGNIDADPFFVNQNASDYHLQDISPCIGSGIDSLEISGIWYISPANDLEGNPRPNPLGSMPDMGAYESPLPIAVGNSDNSDYIPKSFSLRQNYPNPFNPTTTIKFDLPKMSFVQLKIFDVLGKEIKSLISENMSPGKYKYILDGNNLSSGLYFIQLQAGNFLEHKKVLLLK